VKESRLAQLFVLFCLVFGPGAVASADAEAVPSSAEEAKALPVGAHVPDATLQTIAGKSVRLADITGKKPVVLIFYRGGW
jgi:cytochrome oxidase Cu insertion factor (SCO1/SenC/PrrC family)